MGLCLSCLKPSQSLQEEEDTSLLSDDKARIVEDELLTELRNKQLNAILNSTNDHLIDIATIKMMSNYGSTIKSENENNNNNNDIDDINSQINQDENDVFKVTPISQSIIQNEMKQQYNDWKAKYGESTIKKYLTISEPDNNDEKYTVDFV
jgi:hypothetical protein